jgi:nucleoside-diphosphate-sugar epimerase
MLVGVRQTCELLTGDQPLATVASLTAEPRVYNIVDGDPSPVVQWLPAFARWVDALPPPRITEEEARAVAGEDSVYYGTKLRVASNTKAREHLSFRPRRLQWLQHGISSAR